MVEDGDAVADLFHFIEQVARQDDGDAVLLDEVADEDAHRLHAGGVEAVGRFIEDEQFGAMEESGGEGEALAHAHGEGAGAAVGGFGEADAFEHGGFAAGFGKADMRAKTRSASAAVRKG